ELAYLLLHWFVSFRVSTTPLTLATNDVRLPHSKIQYLHQYL
ncbi:hypothetical protein CISIN_1g0378271mg, partial [Citrus sinensis]